MKAVVAAFNQEKALVGAFSVITNLWMELFQALGTSPAAAWAVESVTSVGTRDHWDHWGPPTSVHMSQPRTVTNRLILLPTNTTATD